jgi:hypothetical protein
MNKDMGHQEYVLYVAVNGSDDNPGTIDKPFASLYKAKQAVRIIRHHITQPIVVYVREGTYYLPETLIFMSEDSGSEGAPVTYAAYEDEQVVLSGGSLLKLNWSSYRDGIMKAHVPNDFETDQLFLNGERMHMARYPNYEPEERIFNGYASDCFSQNRSERWADPRGGYIHAMHKHLWGDYHYRITGKDNIGNVQYEGGWQNNRQMGMHDEYRFVENIFEELDVPGEWFLDKQSNILYFYPPSSTDLANANIESVRLRHLVEFIGTESESVRYINLKGFIFRQACRTFMETREPLLRSDWAIYRGGAILYEGSECCSLEDCFLDRLGGNAVTVSRYNRHLAIRGCHIAEAGANGISFIGDPGTVRSPLFEYNERQTYAAIDKTPGPLTESYPADCVVEDCLIYRSGRFEKQTAPIQISMSMGITIRHCSIYEVPRAGINISEGTFGGHVIEHCDVFDTVLETGDHGSFNSWGRDRYWFLEDLDMDQIILEGEASTALPTLDMARQVVIRNNRWRCDYGWDIDLDDGSTWYLIYNNLCLSGGIKLREGFYRLCENNIMVNNTFHPHVWFKSSYDIFRRNIVFTEYAPIRMPRLWGHECDWNLLHEAGLTKTEQGVRLQEISQADNHSLKADALFENPTSGDYRVREGSPALKLGFQNFSMNQFGVLKPELRRIAKTPRLPESGVVASESGRLPLYAKWGGCKVKNIVGMGEVSASGLPSETGVIIETIPWGSWQMEKGFRVTDVIVELGGVSVDTVDDLLKLYNEIPTGHIFTVKVFRAQKETPLTGIKR